MRFLIRFLLVLTLLTLAVQLLLAAQAPRELQRIDRTSPYQEGKDELHLNKDERKRYIEQCIAYGGIPVPIAAEMVSTKVGCARPVGGL